MKTLSLILALALPLAHAPALEIEGLPKPAAPRAVKLVPPQEKTLENGLRVIVIERPGLPVLSAQLVVKTGAEADPPKLPGLARFTAQLLPKGTETRSAPEIAAQVEALGASLSADARFDATEIKLNTLSANAPAAFALLAEVVRRPKFAPEEIDRLRRQTLDELRVAFEQPGHVARSVTPRAVLGASPYAHPTSGTLTSLPRIKRDDIAVLHRRSYVPGNALLIIAGNVTAAEGFTLAGQAFGDWTGAAPTAAEATETKPLPPHAILIDMPNAGQAAVFIAAPGLKRTDSTYLIGEVANAILGVGYSSRLNQEIRIKRGLSYGVRSRLDAWRPTGLFNAGCQTKNESAVQVIEVMQAELTRLATEVTPADYFASRQAVLRGDFARELETNEGYVGLIAELAVHGLPLDTLDKRLAAIDAVSAETARDFAAKHLAPAGLSVIVAGRAKDIAEPLRKLFPKLQVLPQSKLDLESPTLGVAKK